MPAPTDVVEALLFASDTPLEAERIREVLDLESVEAAVSVAGAELLHELARGLGALELEDLADALGLERRVGREQEGFDDVSWRRHGSPQCEVR